MENAYEERVKKLEKQKIGSRRNKILVLVIPFIIAAVSMLWLSHKVTSETDALAETWHTYGSIHEPAMHSLFDLTYHLGYGGFIHNFKNFVLRNTDDYKNWTQRDLDIIGNEIATLRKYLQHKPEAQRQIDAIEKVYLNYSAAFKLAKQLVAQATPVKEIDNAVKVDDTEAIRALNYLRDNLDKEYLKLVEQNNNQFKQRVTLTTILYFLLIPLTIVFAVGVYASQANYKLALFALDLAQLADSLRKTQAQFLANMSHEIRTPMNGIMGMFRLLSDSSLTSQQQHFTNQGFRSAKTLLTIINDILDISKIESGKLEILSKPIDIESVIRDVGKLLQPEAERKSIELFCPASTIKIPQVMGDAVRIRQILLNLVSNAIKFTDSGYVEVIVESSCDNDTVNMNISVHDTGCGMEEKVCTQIFDRFVQADSSLTRKVGGTGLGLAISKELVTLMGGEIKVDSVVGEGSTFSFNLRLKKHADKKKHFEPVPSTNYAYLGHPRYQEIIQSMLESWHMKLTIADSLMAVISLTENRDANETTVCIVDSSLVSEYSIEELEKLKQQGVKIIFFSSLADLDVESNLKALPDITLVKPVTPSELYNSLQHLVKNNNPGNFVINADDNNNYQQFEGHCLLVEDDEINQEVAYLLLSEFGMHVDIVENGEDALTMIRGHEYDLVFMDCMMPIMDGYEATRHIRHGAAGDARKNTIVIALTANAMEGAAQECYEAGMNDYLSKPLEPDELKKMLAKWLT